MNVNHINPFLQASKQILEQVIGEKIILQKPYLRETLYTSEYLVVIIGITGALNGQIALSFDKKTSTYIASKMIGEMDIEDFDNISKSAILELCNMIMGFTASIFSQHNLNIGITPPTECSGKNSQILGEQKSICIPLCLNSEVFIEMNIDISYANAE